MHLHGDSGDFPHAVRVREELLHVARMAEGASLMTDLDSALRPVLPLCDAHLLGVIDRERHDLFEIHVLACVESVRELRCVQVWRGRDHHGVERGVLQQAAIVGVSRGAGNHALGAFETLRVGVGECGNFRVGAGPDLAD